MFGWIGAAILLATDVVTQDVVIVVAAIALATFGVPLPPP